jgi:putative aldouronate transport system permease protein
MTAARTPRGDKPLGIRAASYFRRMARSWDLYLILLPALACLIVFKYMPMWGVQIAFRKFNIFKGIAGSPWVGAANFIKLFHSKDFFVVLRNTLIISALKIGLLFPLGIFIALVLNEIRCMPYKKATQTIIYIPHFFSWIIVAGIFTTLLSGSSGLVNKAITGLGGNAVNFLTNARWFRSVIVFSAGWKESGWNAIIYIAAIAGVSQELYEAARIDGAGRLRQMWHVTLPGIKPTIIIMLIMSVGRIISIGFERPFALYNPMVMDTADVISTYVYRVGLRSMKYNIATAVGLFQSVVALILVLVTDFAAKRSGEQGLL